MSNRRAGLREGSQVIPARRSMRIAIAQTNSHRGSCRRGEAEFPYLRPDGRPAGGDSGAGGAAPSWTKRFSGVVRNRVNGCHPPPP